jgi:hypothetical protein
MVVCMCELNVALHIVHGKSETWLSYLIHDPFAIESLNLRLSFLVSQHSTSYEFVSCLYT